jgi:hypothetical protein
MNAKSDKMMINNFIDEMKLDELLTNIDKMLPANFFTNIAVYVVLLVLFQI